MAALSSLTRVQHLIKRHSGKLIQIISRFSAHSRKQLITFLNTSHFLTLGVSIALLVSFFFYCLDEDLVRRMIVPVETEVADQTPGFTEIQGEIRPGDSLTSSLAFYGVGGETQTSLVGALRETLDFRRLKPNDRYTLLLDQEGSVVSCLYEAGPLDLHAVERCDDGSLQAKKLNVNLDVRTVKLEGTVDSSLYAALTSSFNEDPKLVYAFADIFASKIDFNTETRPGDRFEVVIEKYYKDADLIGYGNIQVARYFSKDHGLLEGFYFDSGAGKGAYYDKNGQEFGTAFIRSPLPMARVSSGFTYTRLHPIFNYVRPHLGVDLAAPAGTPIMAASDGKVVFAGWKGGYGKQVVIEHSGGYKTHYAHLSRFAKGIGVGSKVRQKQTIAYVGSTGDSTGPHLDYRLSVNGKFVNPFSVKFRPKSELNGTQMARFRQQTQETTELAQNVPESGVILVRQMLVTPDRRPTFL